MNLDIVLAVVCLLLACLEAPSARRGVPRSRTFLVLWLLLAASFTLFALRGRLTGGPA